MSQFKMAVVPVWLLLVSVVVAADRSSPSISGVRIQTKSGRVFHGKALSRADQDHVWLQMGSATVRVNRRISYGFIEAAKISGQSVSIVELQRRLAELRHRSKRSVSAPAQGLVLVPPPAVAVPTVTPQRSRPHVSSLSINTQLANWDADAETDGLLLDMSPLSRSGQSAAAGGTVSVVLTASKRVRFHHVPRGRGKTNIVVARWNFRVTPETIGKTFRLPFGNLNPSADTRIEPFGTVHVTFAAPGHGVFNARETYVRIRPFE